jgi:hypothetical protein
MDPQVHLDNNNVAPPIGGSQGSPAPPARYSASRSSRCQPSLIALAPDASNIVLCVSPASGSARFGYIYLTANKRHLCNALAAYFAASNHKIVILPCCDFDSFMVNYSLTTSNINFVIDLLLYIIPAGI